MYGVRINSEEFRGMSWDEFKDLLSGLPPDSPLGRIAQIRLEDDKDIIKHFTSSQKKIRSEWRRRKAKEVSETDRAQFLEQMKNAFIQMAK